MTGPATGNTMLDVSARTAAGTNASTRAARTAGRRIRAMLRTYHSPVPKPACKNGVWLATCGSDPAVADLPPPLRTAHDTSRHAGGRPAGDSVARFHGEVDARVIGP